MNDNLEALIHHAATLYDSRNLLTTEGMTIESIKAIFELADFFTNKGINEANRYDILRGITVISAFFENSTRTKLSFEFAARRLGAEVASFQTQLSSISKGESLLDTLGTIDAMGADIWIVRHSQSGAVELMSKNSNSIFLNAGDGQHQHPTQGLLDCYTLWRHWNGNFEGKRVSIIGDIEHSRVARSNFPLLRALGCEVGISSPGTLCPHSWKSFGAQRFMTASMAFQSADAVIFLRLQNERMENGLLPLGGEFAKYYGLRIHQLSDNPHCIVMHPGPVNYGVELDAEIGLAKQSVIREQVANGVSIRMAMLSVLAAKSGKILHR